MELGAFAEGIEPDEGTNTKYNYGVGDEGPVEDNETNKNVIPLNDCSDGQSAGEQEGDTHDKSSTQVAMTKSHIQKQFIPPPHDREYDGYNAEDRKAQREETIETMQIFRCHSLLLMLWQS